jgi:hypothetical protein
MTDSTQAWNEVGLRFAVLGSKLADRYKQRGQEQGSSVDEDRRRIEEAIASVSRQLDQAFSAVGDTIRDPETKDELKEVVRAFGDALGATFDDVKGEVKKRVGGSKDEAPWTPEPPSAPEPPEEPEPPTAPTEPEPPTDAEA